MNTILIDPRNATATFSNCYPLVRSYLECEFDLGKNDKNLPKVVPKMIPKIYRKVIPKVTLKVTSKVTP